MLIKELPLRGSNMGPHDMARYAKHSQMILDGTAMINEKRTIKLNMVSARRHEERLFRETGIRMKPLSDLDIEKIALAPIWQDDAKSEKEMGGTYFPETAKDVRAYYERIEVDPAVLYAANEKAWERRQLSTGNHGALERGFRTAFNNATNTDSIGTNYLHQAQFELRVAGQMLSEFANQVDIPNGYAAQMVPKLGIGQFLKAGPITTESYSVFQPVTPPTASISLTPQKIMSNTFWTGEFSEDALWEVGPTMDQANALGLKVATDHMLLHGDVASGGLNINALGITDLGLLDARLCFDGIRAANYKGTLGGGSAGAFKGCNALGAPWTLNGVSANLAALGKYGIDPAKTFTVLSASVRQQLMQDAKARPDTFSLQVEQRNGMLYSAMGSRLITLGDSIITNLSSGGVPNYLSWTSEGMPINLSSTGTYTGSGTYKTAVTVYPGNWVVAWKRHYQQVVIGLPLSDQFATSASIRITAQPIYSGVSEAVAYNIN